jgi:FtsZ-binding cell division protein ZapB
MEEDSEPPGQGIQRFEDMNPRELQLAIAYLVQETKHETARVAKVQEEHTDQIGALTTEQQRMARTQQRHRERLDTLESQHPPLSVPPHAGDLSKSGRHILTPVDTAMEQQIEFQSLKKKAAFVDWMTRGSGTIFVSLVTAGVIFLLVWATRALTLASALGKRP